MKLKPLRSGWRTYAACAVLVVAGGAAAFGITVPDWVMTVATGAAGLAGRAAIANNARKTVEDARALIQSLLAETSATQALNAVTDADVAQVQSVADLRALLTDTEKTL